MIFLSKKMFSKITKFVISLSKGCCQITSHQNPRVSRVLGRGRYTLWRKRRQGPALDGAAFAFKTPFHPPPLKQSLQSGPFCSIYRSSASQKSPTRLVCLPLSLVINTSFHLVFTCLSFAAVELTELLAQHTAANRPVITDS